MEYEQVKEKIVNLSHDISFEGNLKKKKQMKKQLDGLVDTALKIIRQENEKRNDQKV